MKSKHAISTERLAIMGKLMEVSSSIELAYEHMLSDPMRLVDVRNVHGHLRDTVGNLKDCIGRFEELAGEMKKRGMLRGVLKKHASKGKTPLAGLAARQSLRNLRKQKKSSAR